MTVVHALLLGAWLSAPPAHDSLRAAARIALAAVEGDSADRVRARLLELARDPSRQVARLGAAYLSLFSYDYADADRRFDALRLGAGLDGLFAAHAQLGLAQSVLARGDAARADSLLAGAIGAARAASAALLEAEALLYRTLTVARIVGPAAALAPLARADSLIPAIEQGLVARARCVRAQLASASDPLGATAQALSGAEAANVAGVPRHQAYCLFIAARALGWRGYTDSASSLLSRAADLQLRSHDRAGRAASLQWRGFFRVDAGFYGEGRSDLIAALADAHASGNLSPVGWAHITLAWIALTTGELADVPVHVAIAESLFLRQGDRMGRAKIAEIEVQRARVAGDTAAARQAALGYLGQVGGGGAEWEVNAQRLAGFVAMDRAAWDVARRHLDSAFTLARRAHLEGHMLSIEQDLAVLDLKAGNARRAAISLRALVDRIPSHQSTYRHYTLNRLAEAQIALGDVDRAQQTAYQAANELDAWRDTVDDRRLRQVAFDLDRYDDPAFAVATVVAGLAAAGRTEAAFELAERRRARALLDRLIMAEAIGGRGAPLLRPKSAPVSAAVVRTAIPDDRTVLIEFVRAGAANVTAFVLSRHGLSSHTLPITLDLPRAIRRFVGLLEVGAAADSLARALGGELIEPLLATLPAGAERVVIVPDLELHALPFEALRTADGRALVERLAVSYTPSAAVIARLWGRRRTDAPARLLAFGDPRFVEKVEPGSAARVYRAAFDAAGGLPRLRASAREVKRIARYALHADVRMRDEAGESQLKSTALTSYRVIHLATHALVDDRSPARTALALSGGRGEDGFLSPSELAGLELSADLLVLSACRTARGPVAGGEGVDGLAAPALHAGARAVLVSAWLVGDRESAAFMERFYRRLAQGHAVGAALRLTKLDLIREGARAAWWATYALIGDPHSRVPLQVPPREPPWSVLLGIGLVVLALSYGWIVRRRGRDATSTPSGSSATTDQR